MNKHKLNKGFTIIEVVLVLAIAGLIFLAVFLALPALQRNQRDTQRKNDMSRFKAAYHQYRANNKGSKIGGVFNGESMSKLPNWDNFINEYLRKGNDTFRDPLGEDYSFRRGCGIMLELEGLEQVLLLLKMAMFATIVLISQSTKELLVEMVKLQGFGLNLVRFIA